MLYRLAKLIVEFALQQYFRTVSFRGRDPQEQGPLLIVANHPNVLMDPLLVGLSFKRRLYFLAKSTFFKGRLLTLLLKRLHMVPIYRKQDKGADTSKNEETFRVAAETLLDGKAIVIFPEGRSLSERRLQQIKTGAARIAFQALEQANYKSPLKIQPVGITYSDFQSFQSSVTVSLGEPIDVQEFGESYQQDPALAVRALTSRIEEGIAAHTVVVEQAEHDLLVEKISRLYETKLRHVDDKTRMDLGAKAVSRVAPLLPEKRAQLEQRISEYLALLSVFNLGESGVLRSKVSSVKAFLSIPIVACGFVLGWLPYQLTGRLAYKVAHGANERATAKLLIGLLLFPLWFGFLSFLVYDYSGSVVAALCAFFAIVLVVALTNRLLTDVQLWLLSVLWPGRKKPLDILSVIRDELIAELEMLRKQSEEPS